MEHWFCFILRDNLIKRPLSNRIILRRIEGRTNADDETEAKKLQDWYHFDKIIRQLRSEDEYSEFEPDEIIRERAKAKFRQLYGYEYKE